MPLGDKRLVQSKGYSLVVCGSSFAPQPLLVSNEPLEQLSQVYVNPVISGGLQPPIQLAVVWVGVCLKVCPNPGCP